MKDQYVGDIGDFGKYGLLRALCCPDGSDQRLRLGVVWYRVENDTRTDGSKVQYLDGTEENRRKFGNCDPDLYDRLKAIMGQGRRDLAAVETGEVLPGDTVFFGQFLNASNRSSYITTAISELKQADEDRRVDVVFLDPDNGLHLGNARPGVLTKYALFSEAKQFRDLGKSLVIYQHLCRGGTHEEQTRRRLLELTRELELDKGCEPLAIRWKTVQPRAYLIVPTMEHRELLIARARQHLLGDWQAHFG